MRPQVGLFAITAFSAVQAAPIPAGRHGTSTATATVHAIGATNLAQETDILQPRGYTPGVVLDGSEDLLTSDVAGFFNQINRGVENAPAYVGAHKPSLPKPHWLSQISDETLNKSQTKDRNAPHPVSDLLKKSFIGATPPSKFSRAVQPTSKQKSAVIFRHPQENPFTILPGHLGLRELEPIQKAAEAPVLVQRQGIHLRNYLESLYRRKSLVQQQLPTTKAAPSRGPEFFVASSIPREKLSLWKQIEVLDTEIDRSQKILTSLAGGVKKDGAPM